MIEPKLVNLEGETFDRCASMLLRVRDSFIISRVGNANAVRSRLASVRAGLFDFDGTLVAGNQWQVLDALMPSSLVLEAEAIRNWYFAHTHDGNEDGVPLRHPDWFHCRLMEGNRLVAESAWIAASLSLYQRAGMTKQTMTDAARSLIPRQGAVRLIRIMRPRAIISFGMEHMIKAWLSHNRLTCAVAASRLRFDELGNIVCMHPNLVVSETKQHAATLFRLKSGVSEYKTLVVGDSSVDAKMMTSETFNVLIIPPGETDRRVAEFRDNHLDSMWERLSLVLVCDSLQPLVRLILTARATLAS